MLLKEKKWRPAILKVIFAGVHNAGRSQISGRTLQQVCGPGERVHAEVVQVMNETGLDLSAAQPQKLTAELAEDANLLITMGCGDQCPFVPGLRREDWLLNDPKRKSLDEVRAIRDEIEKRVQELIEREGVGG